MHSIFSMSCIFSRVDTYCLYFMWWSDWRCSYWLLRSQYCLHQNISMISRLETKAGLPNKAKWATAPGPPPPKKNPRFNVCHLVLVIWRRENMRPGDASTRALVVVSCMFCGGDSVQSLHEGWRWGLGLISANLCPQTIKTLFIFAPIYFFSAIYPSRMLKEHKKHFFHKVK